MTVAAILKAKGSEVIAGKADDTLREICDLLAKHRVGAALILNGDQSIAGILSERDVVRALADGGADTLAKPVTDYMTRDVETCSEDDSIDEVMTRMTQGRFRHLPVIKQGKVVGLVSIGDVVKERIERVEREAEEMRSYIAMA